MFYSHQILARKGPLATVWIAAHLQHRLKKSHYTSTDISSTVDRIMFPEAPIALRMSGHLLLGVVRIYSKKVDYLHQDCNVILIGMSRAFTSKEVNLPESAANAPPESVTLPDRFELDALDLDDNFVYDGDQDRFLRSQEEITIPDQIPVGRDFYVAITFDEDILTHSGSRELEQGDSILPQIQVDGTAVFQDPVQSNQAKISSERLNGSSDSDVRPMEEDTIPPLPVDTNVGFQDPGPSNQTGIVNERINEENSPQSFPDIEVMRDAVHDFHTENFPVWPDLQNEITQPQRPANQVMNEKEIPSPLLEDILLPGGQSLPLQKHSEVPASATSAEIPEIFDTRISLGHASPDLAIRSSPPVEQPKPRSRKRKLLIDETIVLTNQFMKKALKDSHNISRKRKPRPGSLLGDWKLRNKQRKEQIFDEPSVTAICPDLRDIFKKDSIIAKPHLVISEETFSEPRVSRSPASVADFDMDIEHQRVAQSPVRVPDLEREIERLRIAQSSAPDPDLDMEIERLRAAQSSAPLPDLDMEIERLRVAQSPAAVADLDMEIERLRQYEGNAGSTVLPEFMPSPSAFMGSPFRRDDFTPISSNNLGSDHLGGTTIGTEVLSTPSMTASTYPFGSEMNSSKTFLDERIGVESTGLYDIPELLNSAEAEDLNFLEADNTPTSSQGTQNVDALCVRTRAVAQFLKRQSPVTQNSENLNDDLILNKILEGKSRKLCARMFFETLVLKSYGLVDVHQEEPYGDISLKLTPTLKDRF